jgi:serine protease Do
MSNKSEQRSLLRRKRKAKYTLTVIAAALAGTLVGAQVMRPAFSTVTPSTVQAAPALRAAAEQPGSFADLIAAVKPAVVNISTSGRMTEGASNGPQFRGPGPEFNLPPGIEQYFRHFFQQQPFGPDNNGGNEKMPAPRVQAVGSGFIVDPSGYVVTNNHVIDGADKITVILEDGTKYPAEVKGRDAKTDLALLKIKAKKALPYVTFGDSDKTRVGDWVIAIGNPFGLGGTATTGIVSARGRDIHSGPYDDYIQIDAPINRGNSGGPLFDTSGHVIGVNTAIYSPNGGSVGIGFAIPSDMVRTVVADLREYGKVARGWFGVQIQTVTEDLAKGLGLQKPEGALVASVIPDSPAAKAGVRTGDVITEYNGKPVTRMRDLPLMVAETKANTTVDIKVLRKGKEHTLTTTIARMPKEQAVAASDHKATEGGKLGLALAPVTPETRQQYQLPEDAKGAIIVGVRPDSPAADIGLRVGDVITMVDQKPVSGPQDVVNQVKRATSKHKSVVMLVKRGDTQEFVAINVG